jgi:hypothetical protein
MRAIEYLLKYDGKPGHRKGIESQPEIESTDQELLELVGMADTVK